MSNHEQREDESLQARRQRLREAAKRKQKMNGADRWEPAAGEVLEGEYLGSRMATHEQYGSAPVYYVEEFETEQVYKLLGRTVLRNEMQQQVPEPGDLVAITFEGMKNSDDAVGEFYAYDVVTA
jgi:hypothetical protein